MSNNENSFMLKEHALGVCFRSCSAGPNLSRQLEWPIQLRVSRTVLHLHQGKFAFISTLVAETLCSGVSRWIADATQIISVLTPEFWAGPMTSKKCPQTPLYQYDLINN